MEYSIPAVGYMHTFLLMSTFYLEPITHRDAGHSVHIQSDHTISLASPSAVLGAPHGDALLTVRQDSKVRPRPILLPFCIRLPSAHLLAHCLCHSRWRVWRIAICCIWQSEIAGLRQYEARARNVSTRPIRRLHWLPRTLLHALAPSTCTVALSKKPLVALQSCAACRARPSCIRQSKTSVPMSEPRESSPKCNVHAADVDEVLENHSLSPSQLHPSPGRDESTRSTADITITIRDVNDEPPTFNQQEYQVTTRLWLT